MMDIKKLVRENRELIVKTRRNLHLIPEPAYTEKKTSTYVAEYLKKEGLDLRTGIAKYGVVGVMDTGRPGPTLMIRSDMDALPITEETGLEFASTHDGAMHACGHDGHMAMVLGVVTALKNIRDNLNGVIKFLFQPAEEGPGGAKPMIEEGVMENPTVDYSIGCHLWPAITEGTIGVKTGPLMAAMDPLQPTVVTVGSFHAGSTFNVIPGEAEMCGTTRTFDHDIWNSWQERIDKIVRGVCESMGATYELKYTQGYPPLLNDESMTQVVQRCAEAVVGKENVFEPEQTMGGEDMAFYLEKSKGCFFFLGTGREGCAPLHNSKFDFDEDVLLLGAETYCRVALDLLG